MKKFLKLALVIVLTTVIVLAFVGCKKKVNTDWVVDEPIETSLGFEGFDFDEEKYTFSITVTNDTEYLFLSDLATWRANVNWKMFNNAAGVDNPLTGLFEIKSKVAQLGAGDNVFYALVYESDIPVSTYIIKVRRRPMYTAKFRMNYYGAPQVKDREVEEDNVLDLTEIDVTREGYTFAGWNLCNNNGVLYTDENDDPINFNAETLVTKEFIEEYGRQNNFYLQAAWEVAPEPEVEGEPEPV